VVSAPRRQASAAARSCSDAAAMILLRCRLKPLRPRGDRVGRERKNPKSDRLYSIRFKVERTSNCHKAWDKSI